MRQYLRVINVEKGAHDRSGSYRNGTLRIEARNRIGYGKAKSQPLFTR